MGSNLSKTRGILKPERPVLTPNGRAIFGPLRPIKPLMEQYLSRAPDIITRERSSQTLFPPWRERAQRILLPFPSETSQGKEEAFSASSSIMLSLLLPSPLLALFVDLLLPDNFLGKQMNGVTEVDLFCQVGAWRK